MHPRMPDEAPTCADAQTVAGAPAGADANTDAHPGPPVPTRAGSPTESDEETDAHTGPTAPVSDAAAAVPLFRGPGTLSHAPHCGSDYTELAVCRMYNCVHRLLSIGMGK